LPAPLLVPSTISGGRDDRPLIAVAGGA